MSDKNRFDGSLEQVMLVWMAVPRKKSSLSDLTKTLTPLLFDGDAKAAKQEVESKLKTLRENNCVAPKKFALTEHGRAAALGFLSLSGVPRGLKWDRVKNLLVLIGMGFPITPVAMQNAGRSESMVVHLLALIQSIPGGSELTAARVMHTLQRRTMTGTMHHQLRPSDEPIPPSLPVAEQPAFDLHTFANQANQAALGSTTGRSDDKVYISHVYAEMKRRQQTNGLTLETFKRRLIEAHHAKLLFLDRADLVAALPQEDVSASLVVDSDANAFHVIRIDAV